ncbi:neutral ceramidase isoform X1 [Tachypleus tridentatus]|uniref:neutral ceramidase isoform X1 n=1 Tax=Tachypleus tridentatus TaxID=6853 RepID=UPI003FD57EA5
MVGFKWGKCMAFLAMVTCGAAVLTDTKNGVYKLGVGIADITGPAAEINMMGYAKMSQTTGGIHFRQYSRAFVFGDGKNRVVFASLDNGMASQLVKLEVVKALQEKFGDLYSEKNVLLSSTHTHSTPAGFLQYVLYIIMSQGFIRQTFDAQVEGIVKSIERAHENVQDGHIYWNQGELYNASINRSPNAYENNPHEEREKYSYNVDKDMFLLKLTDLENNPIGMINWFAVHGTSMNNTNDLISGDNKGYASLKFEQDLNKDNIPGKGPFVAAFAQANEGDVTPNILGPRCIDTGLPCDTSSSTCDGKNENCIAFGPGKDMFESTQIIGQRQYEKAKELFTGASKKLYGPVQFIHQYIDMSNVAVNYNGTEGHTCKPAMGYSFAAGTVDGPGDFNFQQGTKSSSPFWNLVRDFIRRPSESLKQCQHPKPILLATGEMSFPYNWQPLIVPTQLLKIGSLVIVAVPGEPTTMAGRRLREAVKEVFDETLTGYNDEIKVVIAGLSNTYSSYITTYEEYQVQRYEGASTIYGPHTLQAYIQQFQMLTNHLALNLEVSEGPLPPNLLSRQITLKPGVIYDGAPFGRYFGEVVEDVKPVYAVGSEVRVTFVSGHPRNNLQLEGTFLTVERWSNISHTWEVVATDANWETRFHWYRTSSIFGESRVIISWNIPSDASPGTYRIRHYGHRKNLLQVIRPYVGTSSEFDVVAS